MKKIYLLALVVFGFSANSFAQVSATATATATIITPIAISKTVDMDFGNIAVDGNTGGTVVLTPAGTRTRTAGVTLPFIAGTVTAASFTVTGLGASTYALTLPSTATTLTSGGNNMTVSNFTASDGAHTLSGGTQTFTVGATLNVDAAQAVGTYLSPVAFVVTVNYN